MGLKNDNMFTIQGKITRKVSDELKDGRNGQYRMAVWLMEYNDEGKILLMALKAFGDINDVLIEGDIFLVGFTIKCNEWNGRFYTETTVVKAEKAYNDPIDELITESPEQFIPPVYASSVESNPNPISLLVTGSDDLPF
jgi:hypothetical protein